MAARVVVAVVALLAVGWLLVQERDTRLYERGIAASGDAERIGGAESDFENARLLSPDRTPDVGRALVYWTTGRPADARALLEDIVRSEPDNLSAWTSLGWVNDGEDVALERRVRSEMRRLDPLSESPPPPPAG